MKSMDDFLKSYLNQIVIETAGLYTTDDDVLGTDDAMVVLQIPMAMLIEYKKINAIGAGSFDLVLFWKDTGFYAELYSIAESNYEYNFAIDALDFLDAGVNIETLGILKNDMIRVAVFEDVLSNYEKKETPELYQTIFDY